MLPDWLLSLPVHVVDAVDFTHGPARIQIQKAAERPAKEALPWMPFCCARHVPLATSRPSPFAWFCQLVSMVHEKTNNHHNEVRLVFG